MMASNMAQTQSGYLCIPCGSVYNLKNSFKIHFRDFHFNPSAYYLCPVCKKRYKTKNSFCVHISTKHKELKGLDTEICRIKD